MSDQPHDSILSEAPATNGSMPEVSTAPLDELFTDEGDEEWVVAADTRRVRLRLPTAVLGVAILCAGAFWGGAAVQKSNGTTSGRGAAAAATAGASGVSGYRGLGGASSSSSATTGLVTDLQGDTLYVTTSSGSLVKVELSPSTVITRDASAGASALEPGDTVVVEGSTESNGTVAATSVSATAAGVSSAGSLYGGGGGRYGAGGTTSTTSP